MRRTSIASILPLLMLGNSSEDLKSISILISKYGRVKYLDPGGEKQKIIAGAVIDNAGKLKLSPNASALLFSNGHYIRLDEAGEHSITELIPKGGMQKLNFDARFNSYLMAAIDLVVSARDGDAWGKISGSKGGGDGWGKISSSKGGGDGWGKISGSKGGGDGWGKISGSKGGGDGWGKISGSKEGGDGWGKISDSKEGGDGWGKISGSKEGGDGWGKISGSKEGGDAWGDEEGRIVPVLPFGKVPAQAVIFQWSQPQLSKAYVLEILEKDGGIIYSSEVQDNWSLLNIKSLPLRPGEVYAWRINIPDHPERVSTKVNLSVAEESAEELLEKKLSKSDAYQIQDPVLTSLMEAVVLEEAEHFYEAHQRYEMLRQSFKKNQLVKLMQAAFYLRYQLKPRAEQLFWREEKMGD